MDIDKKTFGSGFAFMGFIMIMSFNLQLGVGLLFLGIAAWLSE